MCYKFFFLFDSYCQASQIASTRPSIICLGYNPSLGNKKLYYGCDRLLPEFKTMLNNSGFWGINFYHQEKPQLLIYSYKLKYVRVYEKSGDISCE